MQCVSRAGPSLICVHFEPVADAEQHVLVGDFEAVEFELAMPAMLFRPHDLDAAHDAPAGLVAVIEKGGEPAALVVGGARDDDEMRRFRGAGDEPFAAADDPFAAFLLGGGADHGRIGAAAGRRLGHGEGRFDLAFNDRPQPPFLLRRRADTRQQIHVAVVGRRAIDRQRAEQRARRFLIDRRPGDDRQRHAAEFLRRLRRPQPGLARLLLNRRQPGEGNILVLGKIFRLGFERQHMRLDERARSKPQLLDFGRKSKVHAGAPS